MVWKSAGGTKKMIDGTEAIALYCDKVARRIMSFDVTKVAWFYYMKERMNYF